MSIAPVLTLDEVAQLLRVSRSWVKQLIADGRLRSFKLGTCRRVSGEALVEFIRSCEAAEDEKDDDALPATAAPIKVEPAAVLRALPAGTKRIPSFLELVKERYQAIGMSGPRSGSRRKPRASRASTSTTPATPSTSGASSSSPGESPGSPT